MKAKIYVGAKKYALYIGRKIVEKTLEFLTLPARFISKKVQDLKNYLIYGNSLQNGTPTPTNPVEVVSVGDKTKNLLDSSLLEQGSIQDADGLFVPTSLRVRTSYISVKENVLYTVYTSAFNFRNRAHCYDDNKVWLGGVNIGVTNIVSFTTLPNTAFVCLVYQKENVSEKITPVEVQTSQTFFIEGNATASDYEPYGYKIPVTVGDTTTNIYLSEPLRRIGQYADYIDYENQKVVRNVKEVDVSNLGIAKSVFSSHYRYNSKVLNDLKIPTTAAERRLIFCDKYPANNEPIGYTGNNPYGISAYGQQIYFYNTNIDSVTATVSDFLNIGGVVNYVLVTPTEETITLPPINLPQGTLTIDTDTVLKPSKIEITGDIDNE